jgi:Restriction endonuclease/Topoisomerase DNA binding C4 zinc finger
MEVHKREPVFTVIMAAVTMLGMPLVFGIPEHLTGKLELLAALLLFAAACAGATVVFLHRPNRPFSFSLGSDAGQAAAVPVLYPEYRQDNKGWSLELLKKLEWRRFEELCAAYFGTLGFTTRSTRFSADGGVDIDLYEKGSEHLSIIVHCKAWSTQSVGIQLVRKLRAAMTAEKAAEGVFVASGKFTREARDFAAKENISLIDGADLVGKITALAPEQAAALLTSATQGDYLTPTCPTCAIKMISRTNEGGRKYWGCRNYPRCKQSFFSTYNAPV